MPGTDPEGHPGSSPAGAAALHEVLYDARETGFLGPGPIEPHVRHAEGFLALARRLSPTASEQDPARLVDLGSGGGLPGLVLALGWPACTMVLLDAAARRADFLRQAVSRCGLDGRVTVVQERAEVFGRDPAYRGTFAGVVARSFGIPAVVAECAAPLLQTGGWLVVSEPPGTVEVPRWPSEPLLQLGLVREELVRGEFGFQVLRQQEPCPDRFPRRNGVPTKNPLF